MSRPISVGAPSTNAVFDSKSGSLGSSIAAHSGPFVASDVAAGTVIPATAPAVLARIVELVILYFLQRGECHITAGNVGVVTFSILFGRYLGNI